MKNIAVIGYGYWGKNLVRNFSQLGVLHTICDTKGDEANNIRALYPSICVNNSYSNVIQNKDIDGIVVATPSDIHYTIAKEAMLADKDVFVEKPFTLNSTEAKELVKIAEDRKRVLLVGHLMLYHPAIQLLKDYIQDGYLGDIHYLYSTRVNLGQVRSGEDVIWRLAPHDISIFNYLIGGTPSVISAQGFSYLQPNLPDVAFVTLQFGKVIAHIQVSWLDPHKVRQITIVGSKRMAVFDDTKKDFALQIYDKRIEKSNLSAQDGEVEYPWLHTTPPLDSECKAFIKSMQTREQPLSDGVSGLEVIRVLEAISEKLNRENNE